MLVVSFGSIGFVILSENDFTVVHGVRLDGLVTLAGVAGLGSFTVAVSVGSIELVPHAIGEPLLVVAVVCGNPIILFLRAIVFYEMLNYANVNAFWFVRSYLI